MRWVVGLLVMAASCSPAPGPTTVPEPEGSIRPLQPPRLVSVPPPPEPGGPIVARRPAPPRLASSPDRVALVVGIDRYEGAPDLSAAVADARLVARALTWLGYGEVRLLLDHAATRPAILEGLERLGGLGSGQTGVLFLAGHVRRVALAPDGDDEPLDEAFVAPDGDLIYDGEVAEALASSTAPTWIAVAGCYAGGFSDAMAEGRVGTYASAEERRSYESPSFGRSFLAEFVVAEALLEDGITSVEAMVRHAEAQMTGGYRRFRPLLDDRLEGDLVLAGTTPFG